MPTYLTFPSLKEAVCQFGEHVFEFELSSGLWCQVSLNGLHSRKWDPRGWWSPWAMEFVGHNGSWVTGAVRMIPAGQKNESPIERGPIAEEAQ